MQKCMRRKVKELQYPIAVTVVVIGCLNIKLGRSMCLPDALHRKKREGRSILAGEAVLGHAILVMN